MALDRRLQATRSELKARHDAELQRRAEAALRPTPRRDPSSLLKTLLAEAHAALERGLETIRRQGSRMAELRPRAKRIAFLRDVGLDPAGVHDALAARTEAELTAELQFIKVRPAAFLLDADRFDIAFEALAGDRWRAHTGEGEAPSTPAQTALDLGERWTSASAGPISTCGWTPLAGSYHDRRCPPSPLGAHMTAREELLAALADGDGFHQWIESAASPRLRAPSSLTCGVTCATPGSSRHPRCPAPRASSPSGATP